MRILSWLVTLPLFLLLLSFALANRGNVTVSFWPFDGELSLPLCFLILGVLLLGVLLGSVLPSLAAYRHKRHARKLRRELDAVQSQTDAALKSIPYPVLRQDNSVPFIKRRWFGL